jgi:hypothetical protein
MNNTAVIQVGNSDNKLTQQEWSEFVGDVQDLLRVGHYATHFAGTSPSAAPWQNACWVLEIVSDMQKDHLRTALGFFAKKYRQESIALTFGTTEFVPAEI